MHLNTRIALILISLLVPGRDARAGFSSMKGSPVAKGNEWILKDGDAVVSDAPFAAGQRIRFDVVTDRGGPHVWDQLRILLDYQDVNNHDVLIWTTYSTLTITTVRNGERKSIYGVEGRGMPDERHLLQLDFTEGGIVITADLRQETIIPWVDPARPGSLGFACEGGATGRVVIHDVAPLPTRSAGVLSLSPLFSDHAVLPHGVAVPVWGTSRPHANVDIQLDDRPAISTTANASGHWSLQLPPQTPGGPHRLAVQSDGQRLERRDVLFGEVWFCAGQSNMVWRLRQSSDAEQDTATAGDYPLLRIFPVQVEDATRPLQEAATPSEWRLSEPCVAAHTSAVAQLFGRQLQHSLGMPIGVIIAAKGGTRIESWMSTDARQVVEKQIGPYDEAYRVGLAKHDTPPESLFNAMVAPYARFPVTGFVWYQGESNAWRGWHYAYQLTAMVEDWRMRFPRDREPFLIVQLPAYAGKMDPDAPTWSDLRDAQARVAQTLPGVQLAVTLDVGESQNIHPLAKRPVAQRLALLALRYVYGRQEIVADPPRVQAIEPIAGGLRIVFDQPVTFREDGASDFQLADGDSAFYAAASVRASGDNQVEIRAAAGQPTYVRYAWKNCAKAPLRGHSGLPVAPFRTDARALASDHLF